MQKIINEPVNSRGIVDVAIHTESSDKSKNGSVFKNIYFPFAYSEKVKRRGENYTIKRVLLDDVPLLLLAFSWQASNPVLHGVSLIFLLVSFWCIYDLGYYENDYVAEKYEQKPKLSPAYYTDGQMMQTSYPWLWSLVFGSIGIILLNQAQGVYLPFTGLLIEQNIKFINPTVLFFLSWIIFLVCVLYCFKIYNYSNKQTRTWLYLVLQCSRYYGFLWITSTNLIGISFLFSHILARTLLYIVYRYSGGNVENWPKKIPEKFMRYLILIFMLITICFGSQSLAIFQSWQTWAILAWCAIQGQSQIRKMLFQFKPIFHDGSN